MTIAFKPNDTNVDAVHGDIPRQSDHVSQWSSPSWPYALGMLLVAAFVCTRLDAFSLWTTVASPAIGSARIPDTFASVDHPFHAARAYTLLESLRGGELLRWVGNHQGGYPVEFYPLGEAWLEVGVWALTLGLLPIVSVHKIVVIGNFLIPGLAYWLLARGDRSSAAVPLAALLVHVGVPGGWVHGGSKELIVWGLVTNVTAATALLFSLWALAMYLDGGSDRLGAAAALFSAFALATNTRSAIGLVIIGIGCWLAAVERSPARWRSVSGRLAIVSAVTGALSAPIIIPLLRFSDLYFFVRYSGYESIDFYIGKILTSVSPPVAILGLLGVVLGLLLPGRPVSRAAAISLSIYVIVTAMLATDLRDAGLFAQLEATRLMPFQRLVTIYLAVAGLDALLRWLPKCRPPVREGILVGGALILFIVYVRPIAPVPEDDHGLMRAGEAAQLGSPALVSTDSSAQAEFLSAVRLADERVPGDGAILILGTALSWHQQLWAPTETDRPLFYENFLWFWHTLHFGPYSYLQGNAYAPANVPRTLDDDYLTTHGIAVVLVTSDAYKAAAATSPHLERVDSGIYDTYRVRTPAPIIRFDGGATERFSIENDRIAATGISTGGVATIARNWYPRWRATVNGVDTPITRTADGYMSVPVPEGTVTVELRYAVDGWDWFGRVLLAIGGIAVVTLIVPGVNRRLTRRFATSPAP